VNNDGEAAAHHHTLTTRLTLITDDPNDHWRGLSNAIRQHVPVNFTLTGRLRSRY
jgi:hypothetical protein